MLTQNFTQDYNYLAQRIFKDKTPTAFSRYNEWEYALITWQTFNGAGWFWHTVKNSLLQTDLNNILKYEDDWFIFWIASKQHLRANIFYKVHIKSTLKTFATIFVNNNWKEFKKVLHGIKEHPILVANVVWEWKDYPFTVKKFYGVPFDVVTYYENNKEHIIRMCEDIASFNNKLVLFCAWPLSNLMIYECWKLNKTNRYIDIGSTLDEYIIWRPTRNYQKSGMQTTNQIDKY